MELFTLFSYAACTTRVFITKSRLVVASPSSLWAFFLQNLKNKVMEHDDKWCSKSMSHPRLLFVCPASFLLLALIFSLV